MMRQVLVFSILALGLVFLGLALAIVLGKAWREERARARRRLRRELEPKVLAHAHRREGSLIAAVGGEVRGLRRAMLEEVMLDHLQRIRGAEHRRLARAFDELGYVDELIGRLRSRRWWQRADAAEKLGLSGAGRACEALLPMMADESSEVRLRAAKALGALGGQSSVRQLVHALNEPSRWSTIRLADILTDMGRAVVDELTAGFEALTLPGRLAVLDVLGRIRPLHVVPWLEQRLADDHPDVRARACHALGCIGDPRSAPALVVALGDDAWPVRAMAAKALGRIGRPEAIETLCRAMRDAEWWVRANAAEALRRSGARGVEALERMLDDDDRYASHQAVLMLERMGVIDRRVRALAGPLGPERDRAVALVRRLIAVGRTGRLEALASDPADGELRAALAEQFPELAAAGQEVGA